MQIKIVLSGRDIGGVWCGTRDYAAQEQYGYMQTGVYSDIYSFGMTLTWMLTKDTIPIRAPKSALEKSRQDVTVTVNFKYQGDKYTFTIPAQYGDAQLDGLLDENGYCGFMYLLSVFDGQKVTQ